jgi:hypothetical protein
MVFQDHVPMLHRGQFAGVLVAEYSIEVLMRHFVPVEVTRRHAIAVIDERETIIASSVLPMPGLARQRTAILHDVPLAPAANGLALRGSGYRSSVGLISNTLFWMVVALSVLTLWMLLGTWRHMRRRAQIRGAPVLRRLNERVKVHVRDVRARAHTDEPRVRRADVLAKLDRRRLRRV